MSIDPITTEVIASRLREIAATMEHVLYHSGYSTILRESKDGTAGLTDTEGRVIMLSGGLQYHYTAYTRAVQSVLAEYPAEMLKPGDSFITNDPYKCGNPHVPDFTAVTPIFHNMALIGFGVSLAHKSDIGGLVPGSSGAGAREIYHDGVVFPPVLFQTSAGMERSIEALIRNNSRVAETVLGDLRAQVGCTRIGGRKLGLLCDEYSRQDVIAVMQALIDLTARRLRMELAEWRDGTSEAVGLLDHDGAVKDRPVNIKVRAEKRGESLHLDFTGSAPQTAGPVNLVAPIARSAAMMAVLSACDPTIPVNHGLNEAVTFTLPEASVVNPQHPATVNHYYPTAHLVYATVLSALARLNTTRAVAPSGLGSGAITVGYRKARAGKPTVLYELLSTALGGTSRHDGASIIMAMNQFTPGAPIEVFESEYPIRIRSFQVLIDSAGAGKYRGGLGYSREFEVLEDSTLTVRSANHNFPAQGVEGGLAPLASSVVMNPDTEREEVLGPIETRALKAGDIIRFNRSGGAGFGPPTERDRKAVEADLRNGYISAETAAKVYGYDASEC
jgi:N-methylhydantoinase B